MLHASNNYRKCVWISLPNVKLYDHIYV